MKVDRKISDQKASTPRSKHSATEQRRRSKINDRWVEGRSISVFPSKIKQFHPNASDRMGNHFFTQRYPLDKQFTG